MVFLSRPYLGPYGCCPLKCLHVLEDGQGLLTQPHQSPQKSLTMKIQKLAQNPACARL